MTHALKESHHPRGEDDETKDLADCILNLRHFVSIFAIFLHYSE